MLARLLVVALAGCGRVNFDPFGGPDAGSRPGDGTPGDGAPSACTGTTMGCSGSLQSLTNSTSGMAGNDLTMFGDTTRGPCGETDGGDFHAGFLVLDTNTYRFTVTAAFDTTLYARDGGGCNGASIGCQDIMGAGGEVLDLALTDGQQIVVTVDSASGTCGPVMLLYQAM